LTPSLSTIGWVEEAHQVWAGQVATFQALESTATVWNQKAAVFAALTPSEIKAPLPLRVAYFLSSLIVAV
jgi:hypothetical protein